MNKRKIVFYAGVLIVACSLIIVGSGIALIDLTGTYERTTVRTSTYWCEDNGAISTADNGGLEYSWGNGAVGAWGATMPWSGTVVAMSIGVDTDTAAEGSGTVHVAINGVSAGGEYYVGNPGSNDGGNYTVFVTPLSFVAGDKLTAITTATPVTTTDVVISFWVVYD